MKKLSEVEKETLLIRVLSQGRGSVEYARDLLTRANDPESEPPEPENDAERWCICGVPEDAGRAGKCLLPEKNLCYFLCNVQHHLFRSGSFTVGNNSQV